MKFGVSVLKKNKLAESRKQKSCFIANVCLILMMYVAFTFLFYRQAWEYEGRYRSDLPWHIRFGIEGTNYSFLYFIIGTIYRLFRSFLPIAFFESSIIILTFLLTEEYIRRNYRISGLCATWISAGMLFLCSVYIPLLYPYYYQWSLITQPWHNITYYGMRLFSVPVFFHTLNILERYRYHFTWKDWLVLAIPLLLGTAIKPNFLAGYSLALLCVMIADFVRDLLKKELCISSFWRYICLGSTVFPAVITLFYQMYILYGEHNGAASDSGIVMVFFTSRFFELGVMPAIVGIIRDIAFPILVVIYEQKKTTKKDKFVWLLFLITLIQKIILKETGPRSGDGNFEWGIYNAGYLLFLYMIPKFIQQVRLVSWRQKSMRDKCFSLAGSGMLCVHLLCGIKYFLHMFCGKWFFI